MTQFNYSGQANEPGIYVIFNTQKWRIYVGQAQCFKKRWKGHVSSLTNNKHQNRFLQADFNQCGEVAFEFHVLEIMPNSTKEERNRREEYWIGVHWDKQEQCYNFKKKTESAERSCYSKTPEETYAKCSIIQKQLWQDPVERQKRIEGKDGCRRNKIGKASKQAWTKLSLEKRKALSEKRKELAAQQWKDPEIRARRLEKMKSCNTSGRREQRYTLLSPSGEIVEFVGMVKFCKQNNLDAKSIWKVFKGIFKQHKGWKLP